MHIIKTMLIIACSFSCFAVAVVVALFCLPCVFILSQISQMPSPKRLTFYCKIIVAPIREMIIAIAIITVLHCEQRLFVKQLY